MRIAVIGATGSIGSQVTRQLLGRGQSAARVLPEGAAA